MARPHDAAIQPGDHDRAQLETLERKAQSRFGGMDAGLVMEKCSSVELLGSHGASAPALICPPTGSTPDQAPDPRGSGDRRAAAHRQ